jgi:hypothetical protein
MIDRRISKAIAFPQEDIGLLTTVLRSASFEVRISKKLLSGRAGGSMMVTSFFKSASYRWSFGI